MPKVISAVVRQELAITIAKLGQNITAMKPNESIHKFLPIAEPEESSLNKNGCNVSHDDFNNVFGYKLKQKFAQVLAVEYIPTPSPLHLRYEVPKEFGNNWIYLIRDANGYFGLCKDFDVFSASGMYFDDSKSYMQIDRASVLPNIEASIRNMSSLQWTPIRFRRVGKPIDLGKPMPLQKSGTKSHPFWLMYDGASYHIIPENKKPEFIKTSGYHTAVDAVTNLCTEGWAACAKIRIGKSHLYKARIVIEEASDALHPKKDDKKHPVIAG